MAKLVKEFGRYRVQRVSGRGFERVLICDKNESDRIVVKLEAISRSCFNRVDSKTISGLSVILDAMGTASQKAPPIASLFTDYAYGTLDLVSSVKWFNPYAN